MEQDFLGGMGAIQGAFAQCIFVVAGLASLGVGAFLLYSRLRWMLRAVEVEGEVTGVRQHGRFFYATYRYSFSEGDPVNAMADEGATDTRDMETGKRVKLLAMRDAPGTVHVPGNPLWTVLGAVLTAMGLGLLVYAVTAFEVTGITYAAGIAFILYSLRKYKNLYGSRRDRQAIRMWQDKQWEEMQLTVPTTLEQIRSDPAEQLRQDRMRTQRGVMGALFAIAGVTGLVAALFMAGEKLYLQIDGIAAKGVVTELEGSYTKGKDSRFLYHPVVRFTDKSGKERSFRDREGDNPAAFGEGDEVNVIYLEKEPQESAAIDQGISAWFAPGILAAAALLFLLVGTSLLPRQRDEAR